MAMFMPNYIRRIGLAIELSDGETITIYSDSPGADILMETVYEPGFSIYAPPRQQTDITIRNISQYVYTRHQPAAEQAIDSVKGILEGGSQ